MLAKVLLVIIVVVGAFAAVVATRPDDFRIERKIMINASPAAIQPHLSNLHLWQAWSPWAKLDPNAKTTFEGPKSGVGASMTWVGNDKVGEGTMTITESSPKLVRYKLDFRKPFAASNMADFTLKPAGRFTEVTWSMYGKSNFMAKAMSLVLNCDKMVGDQFEQGLASLKAIVEGK